MNEGRPDDGTDIRPSPGSPLQGRLILLGVTGSIAAYKAAELLRELVRAGSEVQVMMSEAATHFIGPLTLEALSGRAVMLDPLELQSDSRIGHIVAADTADAILVAPATAHWLGAMANGLASDVITATCLASSAPVVVAPAMDGDMYLHPATVANVARLRGFGYSVVEPGTGSLASGQEGIGRLMDLPVIVEAVARAVAGRPVREPDGAARPPRLEPVPRDLADWHIVVSAGGTAEPIDPVRFVGNRSSGKMGMAIARAALARGARVTLIKGTTTVAPPAGAEVVEAETAAQMRTAVLAALPSADALIMAAAVADFRPIATAEAKIPRADGLNLRLEPTADILAEAAGLARERGTSPAERTVIVGFAAETGSLDRASDKATRKGVDLLVANDVAEPGSGFGTDTNRVTIVVPGREPEPWPQLPKTTVAEHLLDRVAALRAGTGAE
ncbi:MAG: bifunctional phosphopantothenoylcysteine decarboxylase/phosphopantothenate--cysteine ligase CoaBC [Chloroflexota bacterium]|jgi:phosphopantothenoylcysteine decarboxylase/phosphopantothenate--cysteine ligase